MKRIQILLLLSMTTILNAMSQKPGQYVIYTEKHDNIVYLYMNPKEYRLLSDISKTALTEREAVKNQVQTVYVICAYESELWQMTNNSMTKIDSWNKENVTTLQSNSNTTSPRSLENPWFFNISAALSRQKDTENIGNPSQLYFNAYGRVGCYLYKRRWDLALNGMIGYNKSSDDNNSSFSNSIGVDSRVYFLKGNTVHPF